MVCHILDLGLDTNFPWVKPSGLLCFPKDVAIGKDTVIHPITTIKSYVAIGEICEIGPNSYIRENCVLADKVKSYITYASDQMFPKEISGLF